MNYTGRPSISGCRPVLSLYPTHRFCQYLLLIFITFTNSSLFNRAFSTNSRRPLSQRLPLWERSSTSPSLLRNATSPTEGRPWQAGSLPTGRLRLDRTQKGGPCLRGQRLLDNAPCQAVAGPDSGALLLPRYCASLVQTKAGRHANGSPSGGAGERSETERARPLTENHRHCDSIALTKSLPIAAQRLFPAGLALSVIASQCHLSQRERLWQAGRRKKPPFGDWSSGRGSFLLGEPMDSFASTFITFIICDSPQKSSTAQKVYSHSSLGISCIFLAKRVV